MQQPHPTKSRQLFLFIVAIFGMLTEILFVQNTFFPDSTPIQNAPIEGMTDTAITQGPVLGSVYLSSDDATWEYNGKTGKVQLGKDISEGEILKNGRTSYLEIRLGNSTLLRLDQNTQIILQKNRRIELISGKLWIRTVSSQTPEGNNYAIDTGLLQSTVSSTALLAEKTNNENSITYVDSGSPTTEIPFEAETQSGSIRGNLKIEESYKLKDGIGVKKKENIDRLLSNEFFNQSLKRDILFLNDITKENSFVINKDFTQFVHSEIESSFPKKSEIEKFFLSSGIRDEVRQFIRYNPQYGSGNLTPSSLTQDEEFRLLIDCIRDDLEYDELRQKLRIMREKEGTMTEEQKIEYQNSVNMLEDSIRTFEEKWSEKQRKRRKEYITGRPSQSEQSDSESGSGSINTGVTSSENELSEDAIKYEGDMPEALGNGGNSSSISPQLVSGSARLVSGSARIR